MIIKVPIILIIATAVAIANDVFLTDFLTLQNNSLEVIHGTGKNKFLALQDHSGRYRISDFSLILALKSDVRYNVKVNQLPDNDVISIPILGSLIDNRPPEKDEYCAHPFPVAAHPVFEKLKSSEVTEVLFPTGCLTSSWVYGSDVIINEYFPRPYFSLVLTTEANSPKVFICSGAKDASIISSYLDRQYASSKAAVLFHIGDEYDGKHFEHQPCIQLYRRFKLILREYQYHGANPGTTIVQIPLSYNQLLRLRQDGRQHYHSLTVAEWSLKRNISTRTYRWAFIGAIFSDNHNHKMRQKAVDTFAPWMPYFKVQYGFENKTTIDGAAVAEAYNSTLFVVGGRGYNQDDCCRYYEAIISGSVPIIVHSDLEYLRKHIFNYNDNPPPFLMFTSWEDAFKVCKQMSPSELERIRSDLFNWYNSTLNRIYSNLVTTLLSQN